MSELPEINRRRFMQAFAAVFVASQVPALLDVKRFPVESIKWSETAFQIYGLDYGIVGSIILPNGSKYRDARAIPDFRELNDAEFYKVLREAKGLIESRLEAAWMAA